MIRILDNGVAVVDGDKWYGDWCAGPGGLDHDNGWMFSVTSKYVQPGEIVVNAGVHIGTLAFPLLRHGAIVYGYEPFEPAFSAAKHNCRHYADRFHLHLAGLWNEEAVGTIELCGQNAGATQVAVGSGSVPLLKLDNCGFARNSEPRVALLVLDCEGVEWHALDGARELIVRHKPAVVVEVNRSTLAAHGKTTEDLLSLLRELGYPELTVLQHQCDFGSDMFDVEGVWKG